MDRGWIPAMLPEEATDLREVHAPADDVAVAIATLPGGILPDDCTETTADIGQPALDADWLPDDVAARGTPVSCGVWSGHRRRPDAGAVDRPRLGGGPGLTRRPHPSAPVGHPVGHPDTNWYRSATCHARLDARVGFTYGTSGGPVAHRWRRLLLITLAVVVGALTLPACGGGDDASSSDPTYVTIGMLDNLYTRDVTRIPVGGTVRFANDGDTIHNAIAADGTWSTEQVTGEAAMQPGDRVEVTVDEPGRLHLLLLASTPPRTATGTGRAWSPRWWSATSSTARRPGGEPIEPVEEWTADHAQRPGRLPDHPERGRRRRAR